MKMLDRPQILSAKLFYLMDAYVRKGMIESKPSYVEFKIDGFDDVLRIEIRLHSIFTVRGKGQKEGDLVEWRMSEFKDYDPETVMMELKDKVVEISSTLPEEVIKPFKSDGKKSCWNDFVKWLSQPVFYDLEPWQKTTLYAPRSIIDAIKFKRLREKKMMRDIYLEALDAYL